MTDLLLAGLAILVTVFLGCVLPPALFAGLVLFVIALGVLSLGLALVWPVIAR